MAGNVLNLLRTNFQLEESRLTCSNVMSYISVRLFEKLELELLEPEVLDDDDDGLVVVVLGTSDFDWPSSGSILSSSVLSISSSPSCSLSRSDSFSWSWLCRVLQHAAVTSALLVTTPPTNSRTMMVFQHLPLARRIECRKVVAMSKSFGGSLGIPR